MTPTIAVRRWLAATAARGSHIPYAGAIALVLAAPFEQREPLFRLWGQSLTTVEVVLVIVLGGWVAWWLGTRARPQMRTELTSPVLLLLVTMLLSALVAPAHRSEALRFTARFASGFLVYLLVVNSVTRSKHVGTASVVGSGGTTEVVAADQRLVGLLVAATVVGTVVAGLGILEYREVPVVLEWLQPFKDGPIRVGGQLRASSTLQYPTITSMYLELVFGFAVGLLLLAVDRRRWWTATALFIALGVMAEGIIVTLSRSGLVVMAGILALVGGLWVIRRGPDRGFWAIVALAAMVAGLLGYKLFNDSLLRVRLTTENDELWYRAQYQVPTRLELRTGEIRSIEVTVINTGRVTWQPGGEAPFRLAYHWLDADSDEVLVFEGLRTELPRAVKPGERITLRARVQAPPQPGLYRLAWDMVQEGRLWFSIKGSPSAYSLAVVRGAPVTEIQPTPMPVPAPSFTLGRLTLWRLAGRMLASRPLLGVGPDNFRLLYGRYAGLEYWDRGLHTNNMYIEFFVDVGIIGGVLFLWLVWRVVTTLWGAWQRLTPSGLPVFLGVAGAVTAFLLHGLVDYFFEFTPTYLMIWITLGLATAFASIDQVS